MLNVLVSSKLTELEKDYKVFRETQNKIELHLCERKVNSDLYEQFKVDEETLQALNRLSKNIEN